MTAVDDRTAGSTITNTASVTASDQTDLDAGNDSDSAALTVPVPPPLPIPSVGIWGLAIMVVLLAGAVAWRTRRPAMKA